MTDQADASLDSMLGLVVEARRLTVLVRQVATPLLARHGLTLVGRGVLDDLSRLGPQTVPALARTNLVTRQAVQRVVDELHARGFVEPVDNPGHQRSRLWALSAKGRDALAATVSEDAALLSTSEAGLEAAEVEAAVRVVAALADALARNAGATAS